MTAPTPAGGPRELMLAVDLGTSGPKAAVVTESGELLSTGKAPVETILLPDGGAEQDPEQVWQAVLDACGQALAGVADRRAVVGVAICSQYSSVVPVDADGRPTMNMVLWMDTRGAPEALARHPGGGGLKAGPVDLLRWVRIHGIPPLDSGIDSLAHMRFVKYGRPAAYERTACFLEPMDYVALRLTGQATANPCSAFLMLLVDNRRTDSPRYAPSLVSRSGIDADRLPRLVRADEAVGTVRAEVAEALGLSDGVTVWAPLNDTQAGAVGSGALRGSHAGVSFGTTSVLIAPVGFKRTDIRNSLVSMPSPEPGEYLVMAENGVAGRALDHLLDNVLLASDGFGDHRRPDAYEALDTVVRGVPPGSGGVLYLPWLAGAMSPAEDSRVRGGFLNVGLSTTRGHMARAVLEGIALNLRWLADAAGRFAGRTPSHLALYGGGACSDTWTGIVADVVGLPVHQLETPRYANCRGMGLLGFQRRGTIGYDDLAERVPTRRVFEPRAEHAALYDDLFGAFVQAFHKNRPIFRALNASGARTRTP